MKMLRSYFLWSFFVNVIFAEVLSTGENVALFVDRMIGDNGTISEISREMFIFNVGILYFNSRNVFIPF